MKVYTCNMLHVCIFIFRAGRTGSQYELCAPEKKGVPIYERNKRE